LAAKHPDFFAYLKNVFFDLWIPDSGFWIPVPDSGFRFRILVSGSGIRIPDSGFWVLKLLHVQCCPMLFLNLRAKESRNKWIVAKALWTELRSEWTDIELQHLFFHSMEESSRQGYSFDGFIRFERRAPQKSVCGLVFLLGVETHRTIHTRRN